MERESGLVYDAVPLEMLLSIMQGHEETGVLRATVVGEALAKAGKWDGKDTPQGVCEIALWIVEGRVHACVILSAYRKEVLLEGDAALACLQQCERLSWTVQPLSPESSPLVAAREKERNYARSDSTTMQVSPQRLVRFDELPLTSLSHRQRQAVLLVNGQRRVSELSQMLSCPPSHLLPILRELEHLQLITFSLPADGVLAWRERFPR